MPNTELLDLARRTAIAAGELAARRRREGVEVADTKSSPIDIVTLADRETETLIRGLLAEARPNDGFLGEESGAGGGTSGLTWIVDPIDGTVNYLYDIPQWAVSIAVVEGNPEPATWTALAGAVVNPVLGEVYTAQKDGGAFSGGRQLHVNHDVELNRALVGTGFAYSLDAREAQLEIFERLIRVVRDVRRIGAASLDLCNVAAGRLDAYYERGLQHWDHAAGSLIAREAGARVSGIVGARESREITIAAAPALAAELERLIVGAP